MKLKRILAALLCATQLLSIGVFAEEEASTEAIENDVAIEVETEIAPDANEVRIYVSTTGDDSNSGSFEAPVKTIAKAVSLAQSAKTSNSGKTIAVTIRGGDYYVTKTITIPSALSGTENAPFVIQNYNGEEVNIKGSTVLDGKFSQIRDVEAIAKIPEEARKYIGVYDLPKTLAEQAKFTALVDAGSSTVGNMSFFVNDNEQTIARWPNTGFDRTTYPYDDSTKFTVKDGASRLSKWAGADDAVVGGYFASEYTYTTKTVTGIDGDKVTIQSKPYYGIVANKRYFIQNLIEELDSPGEYYIDTKNAKLYFYPPHNLSSATLELATMQDTIISGTGLSYVTIKGIGIKNTRGHAIELTSSKNITIDGCDLFNIGHKGIVMTDNTNAVIKNNTMHHIGSNAIVISGGDLTKLTSSNNLIDNNHIYDFATTARTNNPGVSLTGVGCTITNNLFNSSPSQAILFNGNDHTIMYNEFYDLVNEPTDAGAIYSGRNYTWRGNEVAYNYFHDIQTTADKGGSIFVAGVYYDDMMSSVNTHHNVFYNCMLAVMIGGGRDHNFDNNIILECDTAMFMDGRGVGWASYHVAEGGQAYNTIFNVPYNKEPWASKYPELASITEDLSTLGLPMGNSIQNNIMLGCGVNMIANEMKQYGTVENNLFEKEIDTSSFKDYANKNFELKDGSALLKNYPALAEIDMSKMGLREDMTAKEEAKAKEDSFRLVAPFNGETGISNLSHTFTWQKHDSASKYIVNIATDPEMNDVIISEETIANSVDIKFIPSGGKPYWWTVTAVSDAQSIKGEYQSYGVPRLIVSVTQEETDKKELRNNIVTLTTLRDAITEGDTAGTYKKGFKAKVEEVLAEATELNGNVNALQKDIEAVNDKYQEILDSLIDNINYDVVNVGELLENQGAWLYEDGMYTFMPDGSLELRGEKGKINHYQFMIYNEPLGKNVAIKFGYKVNVSSNYCMIGLHNDASLWTGGYSIIIKSNQLEIQRYVGANDGIKTTDLNFYISDNKWVDLEMGALQTGIGTYVYLMADGVMVTSFLDMNTPAWTGDSKFVFGNPSGNSDECFAAIRAAAE